MNLQIAILSVAILVFSAIIHEYMHGWMADRLGDPTAKNEGRLTLNPIPHIDPIGSLLLPLLMILSGIGFVFGYAKPVPFNPYNLRDAKYGAAKVAIAGPLGNLIVALFFSLVIRLFPIADPMISNAILLIIQINIILMVFNLVPIPPLDGSKVIMPFLPYSWQTKMVGLERYGMIFILVFVMVGFQLIIPIIDFLFKLFIGYY